MNILSHDEIIIYPEAFKQKDLQLLKTYYDLIEISEQEQFTLGPNVLSIGQKSDQLAQQPRNKCCVNRSRIHRY